MRVVIGVHACDVLRRETPLAVHRLHFIQGWRGSWLGIKQTDYGSYSLCVSILHVVSPLCGIRMVGCVGNRSSWSLADEFRVPEINVGGERALSQYFRRMLTLLRWLHVKLKVVAPIGPLGFGHFCTSQPNSSDKQNRGEQRFGSRDAPFIENAL